MSIVNFFEEELEKEIREIGLSIEDVENYETKGKNLVLHLRNGYQLRMKDPYLAKLIETKVNEEAIPYTIPRESLLTRLYMLENIFVSKINWSEFLEKYASYTSRELFQRIRELEENNSKHLPKLKEYAVILVTSLMVTKGRYYSTGIDELLSTKTFQELAEIYVKLSTGEISGRDLYNLMQRNKK